MGLVDSFRRYIRGEDYDDEGYDDFVEADAEPQKKWPAFDAAGAGGTLGYAFAAQEMILPQSAATV